MTVTLRSFSSRIRKMVAVMSKDDIIDMIVEMLKQADFDIVHKAYYMLLGFIGL